MSCAKGGKDGAGTGSCYNYQGRIRELASVRSGGVSDKSLPDFADDPY